MIDAFISGAVFYTIRHRNLWTEFKFLDAEGKELASINVPDWRTGCPVIHDNSDKMMPREEPSDD